MNDQLVGGMERDVGDIALECGHQIGPPRNDTRPAGEIVEHFIDNVVGDNVEEMVAVDQSAQRTANQIEVSGGGFEGSIFRGRHNSA